MGKIILTILLMGQTALADFSVSCSHPDPLEASNLYLTSGREASSWNQVTYNFSSAKLICDSNTVRAILEKSDFRCAGLWNFDHRDDKTIGTPVTVEFTHIEDLNWNATYTTSHDYDRREITLKCQAKIEQIN